VRSRALSRRQKAHSKLDFVNWWTVNVSVRESPGGQDKASRADLRSMTSNGRG